MIKIDVKIAAKQVRHCSLPWYGVNAERNDGKVVRLSTWDDDRRVRNLYLVAEDAKAALMLVCLSLESSHTCFLCSNVICKSLFTTKR